MTKEESRVQEGMEVRQQDMGRGGVVRSGCKAGIAIKFSNDTRCGRSTTSMQTGKAITNFVLSEGFIQGGTSGRKSVWVSFLRKHGVNKGVHITQASEVRGPHMKKKKVTSFQPHQAGYMLIR